MTAITIIIRKKSNDLFLGRHVTGNNIASELYNFRKGWEGHDDRINVCRINSYCEMECKVNGVVFFYFLLLLLCPAL